jgi:hypothetical protein
MEAVLTGVTGVADAAEAGAGGVPKKNCRSPCAEAWDVAVNSATAVNQMQAQARVAVNMATSPNGPRTFPSS